MKNLTLRNLIFMALCADLGIVVKKIISPFANIITDSLHIPGGIGTAFSISFIVIGAVIVHHFGAGMLMSIVQCVTAMAIGSVGSMGSLSIVAYFMPGLTIDLICLAADFFKLGRSFKAFASSVAASIAACLTANFIVFGLKGYGLCLYLCVGATAGAVGGTISMSIVERIVKLVPKENTKNEAKEN